MSARIISVKSILDFFANIALSLFAANAVRASTNTPDVSRSNLCTTYSESSACLKSYTDTSTPFPRVVASPGGLSTTVTCSSACSTRARIASTNASLAPSRSLARLVASPSPFASSSPYSRHVHPSRAIGTARNSPGASVRARPARRSDRASRSTPSPSAPRPTRTTRARNS